MTNQRNQTCDFSLLFEKTADLQSTPGVAEVLTLEHTAEVLHGCPDPLVTLHLVLPLFAGLPPAAISKLNWDAFKTDGNIHVPALTLQATDSDNDGDRDRRIPVILTLDDWLDPFYASNDNLFTDESLQDRTANVLRAAGVRQVDSLRCTFLANCLQLFPEVLPDCAYAKAGELPALRRRRHLPIDQTRAHFTMRLTPRILKIADWPERVARSLKNYASTKGRPAAPPAPRLKTPSSSRWQSREAIRSQAAMAATPQSTPAKLLKRPPANQAAMQSNNTSNKK